MREENKPLAAILSSLISQILVLISLLFPSPSNSTAFPNFLPTISPLPLLLAHFLSAADSAAVLSLSKKRKRAPDPDADNHPVRRRHGSPSSPTFIPQNPDAFKHAFRMNSSTFEWLCGLLEPLLECRDPVQAPLNLPAETRLGIGLFRLATGSDYGEISQRFDVTEAIAKFCVKQLCRVLCTNYRFWVGFPGQPDLCSVSVQFESLSGLPNCCGVIDCLRFKILKSDTNEEEDTISAQLVVDASSRILSVVAGFRGNRNKFWVLKSSALYQDVENKVVMNSQNVCLDNADVSVPQYFIGDDEYPLLPWLIIPFADPVGDSNEENFNNVVRIMRIPMVKTAASLRGWGVLSRPVDTEFKAAIASIGACSILHNMLLTREDYSAFCDEVEDGDGGDTKVLDRSFEGFPQELSLTEKGNAIRNALVTTAKMV